MVTYFTLKDINIISEYLHKHNGVKFNFVEYDHLKYGYCNIDNFGESIMAIHMLPDEWYLVNDLNLKTNSSQLR